MKKSQAKAIAIKLLVESGYKFKGESIAAPDTTHPLDAISIQNELSDIIFDERFTFQLQYIGDTLKLVDTEI